MKQHQKTVPTECVTPNVPRIKNSFFNRKYRDFKGSEIQLTPTTPKVTIRNRTPTPKNRSRKRSGRGIHSRDSDTYNRNNGRPARSRPSCNEYFDPDFSTPRANKSLLTPTSSARLGKNGRITHLIYRPLELDNDSSSELTDNLLKQKQSKQLEYDKSSSPLAIEADSAEVTLTVLEPSEQSYELDKTEQQKVKSGDKVIELIVIGDSDESQDAKIEETKSIKRIKSEVPKNEIKVSERSQLPKTPAKMVEATQCITPPTTPPDKCSKEEEHSIEVSPTFIPGECDVEALIRLYGNKRQVELPTTTG